MQVVQRKKEESLVQMFVIATCIMCQCIIFAASSSASCALSDSAQRPGHSFGCRPDTTAQLVECLGATAWRRFPLAQRRRGCKSLRGNTLSRLRGGSTDPFFEGYNALKNHNDFGNDGHIYQVEYALQSVKRGLTVVAVKGDKCLALAVERRAVQTLQIPETMRKIHQLDAHVVATVAGLAADAPPIVDRARVEALTFRLEYEDCASIEYMARFIADVMLECTMDNNKRPYGCSLVVTGLDLLTGSLVMPNPKPYPVPRIFVCDPSGVYKEWKAVCVGRNSDAVMDYMRANYDQYVKELAGKEGETEERMVCEFALAALNQVLNVQNGSNVEVATMTAERGVRMLLDDEVQVLVDSLLQVQLALPVQKYLL